MAYFVVTTVHGPNWDETRAIREQDGWEGHARFMDELVEDGFVVLGGPVGDHSRAMLVIDADDEHQIEARFENDPWKPTAMLEIGTIERWTIWLDGTARTMSLGSD